MNEYLSVFIGHFNFFSKYWQALCILSVCLFYPLLYWFIRMFCLSKLILVMCWIMLILRVWDFLSFLYIYVHVYDFPGGSMIENPPAMQGMQVYSWVWKIFWERKCQPTSLFLSGKSPEQTSLVGYPPWGFKREEHDLAIKYTTNTPTNTHACV